MSGIANIDTLLTDHLDLWTSAIARKPTAGRGRSKKFSLYGIEKLRALILELAVRGKLVPQDPEDEPAVEFLRQIEDERAHQIQTKSLKKKDRFNKAKTNMDSSSLPAGWVWTNLYDVSEIIRGVTYSKNDVSGEDGPGKVPLLRANNIQRDIELSNLVFVIEKKVSKSQYVRVGDMVVATSSGSADLVGKAAQLTHEVSITFGAFCAVVRPHSLRLAPYFRLFFATQFYRNQAHLAGKGIGIQNLNKSVLEAISAPLPPEAEQHRIVAKVDELMALCDRLEAGTYEAIEAHRLLVTELLATLTASRDAGELADNWTRIEAHFDTLFVTEDSIDQLKQTILQLAMMGRLVPQDPKDEPAAQLLKRAKIGKAELVAQGKVKKSKPLTPIMNKEKPFDLPIGWEWSRLIGVSTVGTGATPSRTRPDYYDPPEINWVTSGETSQNFINDTKEKISLKALQETNVSVYPPGTLLIALYGQGKTRGQVTELNVEAGTNQACAAIRLIEVSLSHRKFVRLFLEMAYHTIRLHSAGGAQPNLNVGKIANLIIPIPPLDEQERIVAKVDELMDLCDALNARFATANDEQKLFAETIVAKAVA